MKLKLISRRLQFSKREVLFLSILFYLIAFGLIMVFSASSMLSMQNYGHSNHFLFRQLFFVVIGCIAFYITMNTPYERIKKAAPYILLTTLFLVLLVLVPGVGTSGGGATRWLPLFGFTLQPSEFLKLAVIIFMAASLSKKLPDNLKNFKYGFLPYIFLIAICMRLLLYQKDFGSAMTIAFVGFILLFIAGTRIIYMIYSTIGLIAVSIPLIMLSPYRMSRVMSFLDPWLDFRNKGYQIIQSYVAFQSGGMLGQGLGAGKQKLFYLPAGHTDFIFSVLSEELGLLGSLTVILSFFFLFWNGIKMTRKVTDPFGYLLASGIMVLFAGNVLLNLCVVTGLLPTKGATLPLFSYGGSSFVMHMIAFGIFINIVSGFQKTENLE